MGNPAENIISDMSVCVPSDILSRRGEPDKWRLIDYSTEDISGTLLISSDCAPAPPITLPLNAQGWHAIYVGIPTGIGFGSPRIKLTDDPCFYRIAQDPHALTDCPTNMWEGFWKCADLTGQELIISRGDQPPYTVPCMAYVKLVPLSDEQVKSLLEDRASTSSKKLTAYIDGYSFLHCSKSAEPERVYEIIEPLRDTDFGTLIFDINSPFGISGYKSGHMEMMGEGVDLLPDSGAASVVKAYKELAESGKDMVDLAIEHAKGMGLKVLAAFRTINICDPPLDELWTTRFAMEHPEYWCRDKEGNRVPMVSWVYDEVRSMAHKTFGEVLDKGMDGLTMLFIRSGPFTLYEQPAVDEFTKRYGIDPRTLDEMDPRWTEFKCDLMTKYMKEIRGILDEESAETGSDRLQFAVEVHAYEADNRYWGVDIARLAGEGIVDIIIAKDQIYRPGTCDYTEVGGKAVEVDYEYFRRAVEGTSCKLYHDLMPRVMPPDECRRKARKAYENGCDGLMFWDTDTRYSLNQWEATRRLGHPDELEKSSSVNYRKITMLNGVRIDRYFTWWSN